MRTVWRGRRRTQRSLWAQAMRGDTVVSTNPTPPTRRHPPRALTYMLAAGGCGGVVALFTLTGPIPQDPTYHDFADTRTLWGIPNALDVLSNLPFAFVGALGLRVLRRRWLDGDLVFRVAWLVFFLGLCGVALGSSYYHWSPDNDRLLWDRLPMTIGFTALVCVVVAERIGLQVGRRLFPALLFVGVATVLYWRWSETAGAGDLRPYGLVQLLPILAIPLILWVTRRRFDLDGHYLV
ncbi:MAG: hypothetical protein QF464_18405, partial [Myxococcota bacterium]|nr:hypothetical protein [Myxococcota bacterium]